MLNRTTWDLKKKQQPTNEVMSLLFKLLSGFPLFLGSNSDFVMAFETLCNLASFKPIVHSFPQLVCYGQTTLFLFVRHSSAFFYFCYSLCLQHFSPRTLCGGPYLIQSVAQISPPSYLIWWSLFLPSSNYLIHSVFYCLCIISSHLTFFIGSATLSEMTYKETSFTIGCWYK